MFTLDDSIVQEMCRSFVLAMHRLLVDHLPGVHHSVTDLDVVDETKSVPTTNVNPERDFAIFAILMLPVFPWNPCCFSYTTTLQKVSRAGATFKGSSDTDICPQS